MNEKLNYLFLIIIFPLFSFLRITLSYITSYRLLKFRLLTMTIIAILLDETRTFDLSAAATATELARRTTFAVRRRSRFRSTVGRVDDADETTRLGLGASIDGEERRLRRRDAQASTSASSNTRSRFRRCFKGNEPSGMNEIRDWREWTDVNYRSVRATRILSD